MTVEVSGSTITTVHPREVSRNLRTPQPFHLPTVVVTVIPLQKQQSDTFLSAFKRKRIEVHSPRTRLSLPDRD